MKHLIKILIYVIYLLMFILLLGFKLAKLIFTNKVNLFKLFYTKK